MADNQTISDWKARRLKLIREYFGLNQTEFGSRIGVQQQNIAHMESGRRSVGPNVQARILSEFDINPRWWAFGDGEMLLKPAAKTSGDPDDIIRLANVEDLPVIKGKDGVEFRDLGNGQYLMSMPVVDTEAKAGYLSGFADRQLHESVARGSLPGDNEIIYTMRGEAMNSNDVRAICDGDSLNAMFIDPKDWPVEMNKGKIFVIRHKEGVYVRKIIRYDDALGIIETIAYNKDKNLYPDLKFRASDIEEAFRVLTVGRSMES